MCRSWDCIIKIFFRNDFCRLIWICKPKLEINVKCYRTIVKQFSKVLVLNELAHLSFITFILFISFSVIHRLEVFCISLHKHFRKDESLMHRQHLKIFFTSFMSSRPVVVVSTMNITVYIDRTVKNISSCSFNQILFFNDIKVFIYDEFLFSATRIFKNHRRQTTYLRVRKTTSLWNTV